MSSSPWFVALVMAASLGGCALAENGLGASDTQAVGSSSGGGSGAASGQDAGSVGTGSGQGDDGAAPGAVDSGSPGTASGGDAGSAPEASPAEGGPEASPVTEAGTDAPLTGGSWSTVSYGVTTRDYGPGNDIVIAYGGYSATDADSQAWVTALTTARLAQLGVGHTYAVRGPEDPDYSAREIGNSELAAAITPLAASASHIVIVAHSSGGFVADELFTFINPEVMAKVAYFNLDGGSWALDDDMVSTMLGVYFCNAHDSVAGYSENTSSDEQLHQDFSGSRFFTVDADGSGCDVGAGWCLHDTLITNRPHDPTTYDLALDYTDFTGTRHVVTSFLDQAVSDGVL